MTERRGKAARIKARLTKIMGWRGLLISFILGLASALALPPIYGVIVLVPALTILIWLIDASGSFRRSFYLGWWFGFGHFTAGLYWVASAFLVQADVHGWMAPFAVIGLAAWMAVFPGLAALAASARHFNGIGRVLVFASTWTASEWLRGWALTGFPWNPLGSVWAFSDEMIQSAAVIGVHGLGFLTVAAAAMPAVLADDDQPAAQRWGAVGVTSLVIALLALGGFARLGADDPGVVEGVRLRLVQANIPQSQKWRAALRQRHVLDQIAMSTTFTGDAPPTHVIWGETAVPYFLDSDPNLMRLIGSAAPKDGLIIVGAPRTAQPPRKGGPVWNSLEALNPQGRAVGIYDKTHLVPFGEYVPLRGLLPIGKLTEGRGDFSAGNGPLTLRLPGLPPLSPLICYEIIFSGRVVDSEDRPQWLLNLTNDAWFGTSTGPHQHLVAARLRAVEEGLPVVRVANTGISAVIDARGKVVAALGLDRRGVVDAILPRALASPPPFARWGNWIVLILVALGFAAGLVFSVRTQATRR